MICFRAIDYETPDTPAKEAERLKVLHDLLILDTQPEERFDILTAYAASLFRVPIALVTLVDSERQWFKSRCGLGATETSRDISFCGHAILGDEIMVVNNALQDPRFADNPLVTGEPRIRFYAGAPLVIKDGIRVGTFCLIDRIPRQLDEWEFNHLRELAAVVSEELQGVAATTLFLQSDACRKGCLDTTACDSRGDDSKG